MMSRRLSFALWLVCITLVGCAATPRFRDQPTVWQVEDTRSIPEPSVREYDAKAYFAKIFVVERLDRVLSIPDEEPAWNTNALDDVPDSSWFQNRISVRHVTPAEAATGPDTGGPPRAPLQVVKGKSGGGNPGFVVRDATGRTFIIKFDTLENPELQTTAGIVVNRIFWTLGYNVPSDNVFDFRRAELSISPEATYTDAFNRTVPMDAAFVDAVLRTSPQANDGSYRAFASEFLKGVPKGGFAANGVRPDDPNDVVPHEHRRELRGLRVFAAWVAHTDIKEDNTLDVYVEQGGRRFLRHYLLDFGEALDAHAAEKGRWEDGWEHFIDWENQFKATFSFGLWKRPWEDRQPTRWASIGAFSATPFDPLRWREAYPFAPFFEMDAADAYWAAKLVLRFDRPLLTAIVAQGKMSDPAASAYLIDTLLARREAIGRAYLEQVTPLDELVVERSRLCAVDLGVRYGLASAGIVERMRGANVIDARVVDAWGRVCWPLAEGDDYTIYRLRTRRGRQARPPMEVHFKGGDRPRVIGLLRVLP
ncbi:MAG TPA: hypothetical protein VER33_14990 [Polyangiaceae bacterium]|nr:hypothetical protein [Polyangiaceae bacterium]